MNSKNKKIKKRDEKITCQQNNDDFTCFFTQFIPYACPRTAARPPKLKRQEIC